MNEIVLSMSSEEERRKKFSLFLRLKLEEEKKSEAHQLSFVCNGDLRGNVFILSSLLFEQRLPMMMILLFFSSPFIIEMTLFFFFFNLKRVKDKFIFQRNLLIVNVHLDNWKRFFKHREKKRRKKKKGSSVYSVDL